MRPDSLRKRCLSVLTLVLTRSERRCVTPVVVVPGAVTWTAAELEFQAEKVLASKFLNAGHNCLSTEIVVTARTWPQREAFLAALRQVLSRTQQRWPWYPGSEARHAAFRARFPAAIEYGARAMEAGGRRTLPWMLVEGLSPHEAQTDRENWCGVLQEVALDTPNAGARVTPGCCCCVASAHLERCADSVPLQVRTLARSCATRWPSATTAAWARSACRSCCARYAGAARSALC